MSAAPSRSEQHSFHFSGIHIPAAAFYALEAGSLSADEVFLLCLIDALSDKRPGGVACYASNQYLGVRLGKQRRQIIRLVNRLESKKILKKASGFRNGHPQRFLHVRWHRLVNTRQGVTNDTPPPCHK